ncbi:MAG: DUF1156 domain-containing protein [Phycisphaerae bacterium]
MLDKDTPRLIEVAFPLKQASLDSVHEKNVRHGHISTLHIWPARRPLAACRAALIATLLPDPGTPQKRRELIEKIGGRVIEKIERKKMPSGKIKEIVKEETVGGILHWGRETENKETLDWFRAEIRKAYGGRAPKVLDPFAGGGAIPLEAMRLGCEVTAIDLNPVAWFILKCTLEYPQKLAGQKRPLPEFILKDREFMEAFFKAQGLKGVTLRTQLEKLGFGEDEDKPGRQKTFDVGMASVPLDADLAWHVRAWGKWVLAEARKDLAKFYPTYADFQPIKPDQSRDRKGAGAEKCPMRLVPLKEDGTADIDVLNAEFDEAYLENKQNPRWVAKPTVAYLWARTVKCKNCRATFPLLKSFWLSKKANRRVLLTIESNAQKSGITIGIESTVPVVGGNAAQRREHDRSLGKGTMTRRGATCPCCKLPSMTMDSIRLEGRDGHLGAIVTAVMVDGPKHREYRRPTDHELLMADESERNLDSVFADIPFGRISEPIAPASTRSISCDLYGLDSFAKAFTPRQQLALGSFVRTTRSAKAMLEHYRIPHEWREAIFDYLAINIDRLVDRSSVFCRPDPTPTQSGVINTFSRFALPMTWDFIEGVTIGDCSGGYGGAIEWIAKVIEHLVTTEATAPRAATINGSATEIEAEGSIDVIVTDPPYYQAISYADLSDLFYIWQRRLHSSGEFAGQLSSKELEIVQHVRADKSREVEKEKYEARMYEAFCQSYKALTETGRFVVVFAHKDPTAWETLVSAIIRAGFVVTASWPIQTEMPNRGRALATAALASSIWLVCRKRPLSAGAGWDNQVIGEMCDSIHGKLRRFWDAGIRGPDFVWASTGPAMEAYSKHPVVKKANDPGKLMEVSEFLRHARRIVVDFVVGRVLSHNGEAESVSGLDDITTYYLLHRHDFKMKDAPIGACILYAISCGLLDKDLADRHDILARTGKKGAGAEDDEESADVDEESGKGGGSTVKLKTWKQRTRSGMGYDPAWDAAKARRDHERERPKLFDDEIDSQAGTPVPQSEVPLIDQVHRLMHLWKAGDVNKVDSYLDTRGLRRSQLFAQVLQALIELAEQGSEERSLMESISNHLRASGTAPVSLFDGSKQEED